MLIVGIDEAGRGPIAGPVVVGAFVFLNEKAKRIFRGVKESKQLSEKRREEWFGIIEQAKDDGYIDFHASFQGQKVIDKKGISYAIRKALEQTLDGLSIHWKNNSGSNMDSDLNSNSRANINLSNIRVLLDGGLNAPACYTNQKTIIKGDEKKSIIALASICAKVARDRYMNRFAKKFPKYRFEKHKGYGTKRHYAAIKKYGFLSLHRRSFVTNMRLWDNKNRY